MNEKLEAKFKKLEFYQNIIARMNSSSMQVKIASYTLSAIILGSNLNHLVAILPIIMFWFLDAYYLANEKQFRSLYNQIADKDCVDSLQIGKPFDSKWELLRSVLKNCKSLTIVFSYAPLLIVVMLFHLGK